MKYSARRLALDALLQIEEGGAYSNLLLNQVLHKHPNLDPRDRNLITELIYGTIQHQRLIDFHLQPYVKQPLGKLQNWVKQLLRLSIYQLLFLDRIPERAVVHEAVELSKKLGHRGITGMVNGVLRNYLRSPRPNIDTLTDPIERIAVKTSHPSWLVKRWVKQLGLEETERICEENNRVPHVTIRVNRRKGTREEVKQLLSKQGIEAVETEQTEDGLKIMSGHVAQSPLHKQGYFTFQDESSMLIAPLLNPQPGMTVLDACAAPGGKTTHLAELMDDKGEIVANDLHPHKEKLIQDQVKRLGLTCIRTIVEDASKLKERFPAQFDRILLDAPCSGFGVIKRKPDVKWKKKESDIADITKIQYDLLCSLSSLLKKGGELVYSTCTIEAEENQLLVERFIQEHPDFSLIEESMRQILPHHYGSDGFFMCKIIRK